MSSDTRNRFSVMSGAKPAEPDRNRAKDIGHYFEQTVLDRHTSLLAARASTLALNEELLRLGVAVDPDTGVVTILRA